MGENKKMNLTITHSNVYAISDIHNDGMCNPSIMTAYAVSNGDKEIKQKTTNMLHLLSY